MIDGNHSSLSMVKQCSLLGLHRSGLYYKPCSESLENLIILRLLDEQYFKTPFYGARKLTVLLKKQGFKINRKRVKRLMELMGWRTLYRYKNTSEPDKQNRLYPYMLKGLRVERPNQVWAMDITYVPMRKGFMYLCAIIDLRTRFVVNWSLSNTMTAEWCKQAVEESLETHGCPEILNTDQGSQFTSDVFTGLLKENNVQTAPDKLPDLMPGTTTNDVEATIHSHPLNVTIADDKAYGQSADVPSDGDKKTFSQYNRNIIVGPLGQLGTVTKNSDGTLNIPSRPIGIAIYDRNSNPIIDLTRRAVEKILK
jgi:putative transposase